MQAQMFPLVTRDLLFQRLARITSNAHYFAKALLADSLVERSLEVRFPGLPSHPDYEIGKQYPHLGGILTFVFYDAGHNHSYNLKGIIERIILNCAEARLQITHGVSFGFTAPRISAASSLAESDVPFLRLFVGDVSEAELDLLANIMIEALHHSIQSIEYAH